MIADILLGMFVSSFLSGFLIYVFLTVAERGILVTGDFSFLILSVCFIEFNLYKVFSI